MKTVLCLFSSPFASFCPSYPSSGPAHFSFSAKLAHPLQQLQRGDKKACWVTMMQTGWGGCNRFCLTQTWCLLIKENLNWSVVIIRPQVLRFRSWWNHLLAGVKDQIALFLLKWTGLIIWNSDFKERPREFFKRRPWLRCITFPSAVSSACFDVLLE